MEEKPREGFYDERPNLKAKSAVLGLSGSTAPTSSGLKISTGGGQEEAVAIHDQAPFLMSPPPIQRATSLTEEVKEPAAVEDGK